MLQQQFQSVELDFELGMIDVNLALLVSIGMSACAVEAVTRAAVRHSDRRRRRNSSVVRHSDRRRSRIGGIVVLSARVTDADCHHSLCHS